MNCEESIFRSSQRRSSSRLWHRSKTVESNRFRTQLGKDKSRQSGIPGTHIRIFASTTPQVFSLVCRLVMGLACGLGNCLSEVQAQQNPDGKLPVWQMNLPHPLLLRDEAVLQELRVTQGQRDALTELSDRVDKILWPARNKPAEQFQAEWQRGTEIALQEARELFTNGQQERFDQILLWLQGTPALAREDLAEKLRLTENQRHTIASIVAETALGVQEQYAKASQGEPVKPLEAKVQSLKQTEHRKILRVLNERQRGVWAKLQGKTFDINKLGRVTFAAPELIAERTDWLDPARAPDSLAGQVAVVHFFVNGCINCVRNYEHYRGWQADFIPRGLLIVGIHTPETRAEHDIERLRQKVNEADFEFPVLIDNDKKNWNAWGNGMWPSVYLVDRQGRIRYWWYGELNWQGAEGEKQLRKRIQELLAERGSS